MGLFTKSRKEKLVKRLHKAFSNIHMLGIKGHDFALGLGIAGFQEKYDVKYLLKDKKHADAALKGLGTLIQNHDINSSEGMQFKFDMNMINAADKSYKATYLCCLLVARLLATIADFKKTHSISDKQMKEIFGKELDELQSFLQDEKAQVNSIVQSFKGHTGVALAVKDMVTMDNYLINYIGAKMNASHLFRNEKRVEKMLGGKTSPDFKKKLGTLLADEVKELRDLLKMINVSMKRLGKDLVENGQLLERAGVEHELPAAFIADEGKIHFGIAGLVQKQVHSIHIILDQLWRMSKRLT